MRVAPLLFVMTTAFCALSQTGAAVAANFENFNDTGMAVFVHKGDLRTPLDVCLEPTEENAKRLRDLGDVTLFVVGRWAVITDSKGKEVGVGCTVKDIEERVTREIEEKNKEQKKMETDTWRPV